MIKFSEIVISKRRVAELFSFILVLFIFLSKISLKYTGVVPRTMSPIVFQYGLHPFVNFSVNFSLFLYLFYYWFRSDREVKFYHQYTFLIIMVISILTIQTFFQIAYVHPTNSVLAQVGGLIIALVLILTYAMVIPGLIPASRLVMWIRNISVPLVLISLLLLPVFNTQLFRGGRFVGVFKHIPHMVSASTFAYIFYFPRLFDKKGNPLLKIIIQCFLFIAVFLTATKAAMVTVLIVTALGFLIYGEKTRKLRISKFAFVSLVSLFILLFGNEIAEFIYGVATGQSTFLMRPAQDGIATRLEEVSRGFDILMREPHFGEGILYKFMSGSEVSVEGYNSFKDPHNIFVSAGVIGGWPFMMVVIIGFFMMIVGAIKGLLSQDPNIKIIGLFLLAHIPVFVIYHVHLSLGGMGDRVYWLVFGYLGILRSNYYKVPS